jgi:hypothetical protein
MRRRVDIVSVFERQKFSAVVRWRVEVKDALAGFELTYFESENRKEKHPGVTLQI